ncbi:MAG: hypothetical protein R3E32_19445 [Chitinophagales bacterium]
MNITSKNKNYYNWLIYLIVVLFLSTACTKIETPPAITPPPIPKTPKLSLPIGGSQYANCLLMSWQKVEFAENYTVQIATDSIFSFNGSRILEEKLDSSEQTYVMDFRNIESGSYYCRVKSGNIAGESEWSTPVSFQINLQNISDCIEYESPTPPFLQMPLDSMSIDGNAVTFSWTSSTKATHYRLEVKALTSFPQVIYDNSDIYESTRTIQSFKNGPYYAWRVKAYNHTAESAWSDARVFRIEP